MLRTATQADSEIMSVIHATAFPRQDAWSADVFFLQLGLPSVIGLLYPPGGIIMVRLAADQAEILTLAVAPELRRSGIATALLSEATIRAAAMGAAAIFLEVSVANTAARQLYTDSGFRQVGQRPRYYSDRSDALVLRLDLVTPHCGSE
jgi:[ribosomal protein S18]-alanine N-acetyltransferase